MSLVLAVRTQTLCSGIFFGKTLEPAKRALQRLSALDILKEILGAFLNSSVLSKKLREKGSSFRGGQQHQRGELGWISKMSSCAFKTSSSIFGFSSPKYYVASTVFKNDQRGFYSHAVRRAGFILVFCKKNKEFTFFKVRRDCRQLHVCDPYTRLNKKRNLMNQSSAAQNARVSTVLASALICIAEIFLERIFSILFSSSKI